LVSEIGLTPKEISQLTQREIDQLKRGQELFNEEKERAQDRGSTPSADQKRREEEALRQYA